jgi:hypothetical protein
MRLAFKVAAAESDVTNVSPYRTREPSAPPAATKRTAFSVGSLR